MSTTYQVQATNPHRGSTSDPAYPMPRRSEAEPR